MVAKDKLLDEAVQLRNTKGNLSGALEKVNQVLDFDTQSIKALFLKSSLLRDMGETDQAKIILQDAINKIPQDNLLEMADAHRLLGFIELLQGNKDSALQLAKTAQAEAEVAGNNEILANTLALLGNIYHAQGKLSAAEGFYDKAITNAKQVRFVEREITVTINLATVYAEKGEKQKAKEILDSVLNRSKGKWSKALFNALFEKVKILRAEKDLSNDLINEIRAGYKESSAQGWADEEGNLALQLGLIYYDLGQPDLAKEYLKKALSVFTQAKLFGKVEIVTNELKTKGFSKDN